MCLHFLISRHNEAAVRPLKTKVHFTVIDSESTCEFIPSILIWYSLWNNCSRAAAPCPDGPEASLLKTPADQHISSLPATYQSTATTPSNTGSVRQSIITYLPTSSLSEGGWVTAQLEERVGCRARTSCGINTRSLLWSRRKENSEIIFFNFCDLKEYLSPLTFIYQTSAAIHREDIHCHVYQCWQPRGKCALTQTK